jgi:hypothetical protein
LPDKLFLQWDQLHTGSGVRLVMFLLDALCDNSQLGLRLRRADAWLEATNEIGAVHEASCELGIGGLIRSPQVGVSERKLKAGGKHTYHCEIVAIDRQRLSDHAGVSPESALPHTVSQHNNSLSTWLVFTGLKRTAKVRLDSEQ